MLSKRHKNYVNEIVDQYITEHINTINLFPKQPGSFCVSANGVPAFMLESEDSTFLLDMDETLIHVQKVTPELMDFIQKNPSTDNIRPERTSLERNEIKRWARENINKFQDVISNYKHKSRVKIIPHDVFGYVMIIFRPHLEKFLTDLESLIGSKDLKEVKVFTANQQKYAQQLVDAVNEHSGKKLKLYDVDQPLHQDSMILDDHEGAAKIKLLKAKVINNLLDSVDNPWVKIDRFTGDLNDNALIQTSKHIKEKV